MSQAPSSTPSPEELRAVFVATKGAKVPSIPGILVKLNNELARSHAPPMAAITINTG